MFETASQLSPEGRQKRIELALAFANGRQEVSLISLMFMKFVRRISFERAQLSAYL